ncbi:hypothetical protein QQM79_09610 [Marinobacteraceae bacterium S3BR75-40.1]
MGKLKSYQEQVQDIIEKGINTVEEQHKTLIARPFEFAEKVEKEAKSYSIQSVRDAHNEYANNLYSSLRKLNKRLGEYAAELIGRIEKEEAAEQGQSEAKTSTASQGQAKKATPKKSTARKSTAKKSSTSTAETA